ncbi:MAG: type I phosphomannose isomerase catalytic subunit [Gammaproteobacteria bacterium]|nr:type I phosphomannose isomerase catalytic subunit [Gammaproteobacteria bacterium]
MRPRPGPASPGRRRPAFPGRARWNYRDDRHKPELLVALSGFRALCGFRSLPDCARVLEAIPELAALLPSPSGGLAPLLETWFDLPATIRAPALAAMLERLAERDRREPFAESAPEYWALRTRAGGRSGRLQPTRGCCWCSCWNWWSWRRARASSSMPAFRTPICRVPGSR